MPVNRRVQRSLVSVPIERELRVSTGALRVREGGTATFDVWLTEAPTAAGDVTVTVESNNTADATVSAASLTFNRNDFGTRQTVTVSGVQDADARDENTSISLIASGGGYDDSATIAVTVEDDDTAGLRLSDSSLSFSSTTLSRTLGVRLRTQPTGDVTVAVSDDSGRFSATPRTLTFTRANWNIQQFVTVRATAGGSASGTLTLDPSGADYGSVANRTVSLSFTLTLPAVPSLNAPTSRYTNANTRQQVRNTWGTAARAVTYEFRYREKGTANWTTVTGLTSTSYSYNADASKTYENQVRSRNASGASAYSATREVTTGKPYVLYFSDDEKFGSINVSTGAFTRIGTFDPSSNSVFVEVDGTLYILTTSQFGSINTSTGAVTQIGTFNPFNFPAIEKIGDTIYVMDEQKFGSINVSTGAFTRIGTFDPRSPVSLVAFDGTLYFTNRSWFGSINVSTGAVDVIGTSGVPINPSFAEIDGILYFANQSQFGSVNVSTGAFTRIGTFSPDGGIEILEIDGTLYAVDEGKFGFINVSTGAFTRIGTFDPRGGPGIIFTNA